MIPISQVPPRIKSNPINPLPWRRSHIGLDSNSQTLKSKKKHVIRYKIHNFALFFFVVIFNKHYVYDDRKIINENRSMHGPVYIFIHL